jgi:sporulation protein YlmC with PRC-barrel domain
MRFSAWTLMAMVPLLAGCAQRDAKSDVEKKLADDVVTIEQGEYTHKFGESGLRAENLLGAKVFGSAGRTIGHVADLLISEDGDTVVALIAGIGGFLDIGDTQVAVRWNEVTLTEHGVRLPLDQNNLEQYRLPVDKSAMAQQKTGAAGPDSAAKDAETWRLTSIMGKYVSFKNEAGFGFVEDVVFSEAGEIEALIVESGGDVFFKNSIPFRGITILPGFPAGKSGAH